MSTEEMGRVRVPVQILQVIAVFCRARLPYSFSSSQGDESVFHTLEEAYELAKSLPNVPGGAIIHVIHGGADVISVPRKTAPQVNAHLAEFVAALTPNLVSPPIDDDHLAFGLRSLSPVILPSPTLSMNKGACAARFRRALWLLAELAGRPEMKRRNPLSIFSFSRIIEDDKKIRTEL